MIYPGIERAALEIAYANGGINRGRTEVHCKRELNQFLAERVFRVHELANIDAWLGKLPKYMLSEICDGEHREVITLMVTWDAPKGTDDLLNDIFDYVC